MGTFTGTAITGIAKEGIERPPLPTASIGAVVALLSRLAASSRPPWPPPPCGAAWLLTIIVWPLTCFSCFFLQWLGFGTKISNKTKRCKAQSEEMSGLKPTRTIALARRQLALSKHIWIVTEWQRWRRGGGNQEA